MEVGAARPDYLSIGARFGRQTGRSFRLSPILNFVRRIARRATRCWNTLAATRELDDANFFVVVFHGVDYMGGAVSFESFSSLGIKDEFVDLYETVRA